MLLSLKEGVITLLQLDGYRLAIRKGKPILRDRFKFVVPEKTPDRYHKDYTEYEEKVKISVEKTYYLLK